MRLYLANTDPGWFEFLSNYQPLDEVNHWQPGGRQQFNVLSAGELLVFKLRSPINKIAGYGVFARAALLSIQLAWSSFGYKNGSSSLALFKNAILRLNPNNTGMIGYRILTQPVFFARDQWFSPPPDYHPSTIGGKRYVAESVEGRALWAQLEERRERPTRGLSEPKVLFGDPILVRPRLGQGGFRVSVIQAYDRRCAITGEKTLPALEAAHIIPVTDEGTHDVSNGLLLRRDLHALFDQHYVTVGPDKRLLVSRRIREEFENGRDYYALHGKRIHDPGHEIDYPSLDALRKHNDLFIE